MILKGKTVDKIRDHTHPFGQALNELYEVSDLVCSSPMVVPLAGEYADVDGGFMLVAQLPLRVYVGMIGRNMFKSDQLPPVLSSFRYYDPLTDTLEERSHNPEYLGAEENIWNIGRQLVEIVKEQHFKFLPAEIVLLSETPPGRGTNWSGAFAAAITLALYLLQGKDIPVQLCHDYWKKRTQIPKRDREIDQLFRIALHIECNSHSLASGYGSACSLFPALGKLLLYKGFIDPKFATAREDTRRNLSFFLCHWDIYQQLLTTGKTYQIADLYDMFIIDSGRSKAVHDNIGRVRGVGEGAITQDLIHLLTNDANQPAGALDKSPCLPDRLLHSQRIGLSALSIESIRTIKTLRDCCGGIEDPRATLHIIDHIDHMLLKLDLSFPELDAMREELESKRQRQQLAVKLTGSGNGGNVVVWGTPEAIHEIELRESSKSVHPTLVWQLSRDGLSQEGTVCNHPKQFQPFSRRASAWPSPRNPVLHQSISIDAQQEVSLLPSYPTSLFNVYLTLRRLSLQGSCLYMYYYNDPARDRFEPLYMFWPTGDAKSEIMVKSSPFHPKEGFVLLKDLLIAFAREGCLCLENPDPLLGPNGRLRSSAIIDLDLARSALNFEANRLERQVGYRAFPHLRVQKLTDGKIRVSLQLPESSCFSVIYPVQNMDFESSNADMIQPAHCITEKLVSPYGIRV